MNYHGFDIKGLENEISQLSKIRTRQKFYTSLNHHEEGKLFIQELRDRRNFAREQYIHIDPTSENSNILLAVIQGREFEAETWLKRFSDAEAADKQIEEKIKEIKDVIKHKQKNTGRQEQIIPTPVLAEVKNALG